MEKKHRGAVLGHRPRPHPCRCCHCYTQPEPPRMGSVSWLVQGQLLQDPSPGIAPGAWQCPAENTQCLFPGGAGDRARASRIHWHLQELLPGLLHPRTC